MHLGQLRIRFLKRLDSVFGAFVATCLPAARTREVAEPRSLLLIRPGGIGDAVLLIPAIHALKERFPRASITVLSERRNGSAFALCPAVDRLLSYDKPSDLFKAIRGGCDTVIDTEQWHRLSAIVARLTGAPVLIGFATNNRARLFSHKIGYFQEEYEGRSFFNLLAPLGIAPPASLRIPFLSVPDRAASRAVTLLAPCSGAPFVAIFPGASVAERRWGAPRFREVAKRLAEDGISVVVVGGKDDVGEAEAIVAGSGALSLAGKTTLAETAAVLAASTLLLSGDSGLLHIAVALDVPTVSLFGPGIKAKWGPQGEGDLVLDRRLPCSPCTLFGTTPPCPIKARCLSEFSVDEVYLAVTKLFRKKR
jgi:ADP-heptose:LPS heptosyltransferase